MSENKEIKVKGKFYRLQVGHFNEMFCINEDSRH